MPKTLTIDHKRGDTFAANLACTEDDGTVTDLSPFTVTSQLRLPDGTLVADCVVTFTDAAAGLLSAEVADTSAWPVTPLEWDIQFASGDSISSTVTVIVRVLRDVTYPVPSP